ncbi:MAG: Grx4 family monothiol glutaredoxin [Burkholderiaceae bacterium]
MDAKAFVAQTINDNPVVLFMKGTAQFPQCGFSGRAIQLLKSCGVTQVATVNVLEDDEGRQAVKDFASSPTVPQLYVKGEFIGGSDIMGEMYDSGELKKLFADAGIVGADS